MRAVLTSIAFAAGALTAWMMLAAAADLRAQGERSGALPVCAGAGGVLRVTTPSGSCEPGQKRLTFFVTGPASSAASAETEALERALRDVERQVADLERLAGRDNPSTVTAPFNVEDRSGRVVFSVANGEYSGTYVNVGRATLSAIDASGGHVRVISSSGNEELQVGQGVTANLEAFGLEIGEKERGTELALGRGVGAGAKDMYRLNVAGSRRAAVVGQSSVGRGLMFVCDATGAIKSAMFVPSGGAINIRNSAEIAIAAVKQGANGGELEITSSNGEPMVRAAVHQNGYGVVAAGPGAFRSGMGVLGLPGSFIVGKAR